MATMTPLKTLLSNNGVPEIILTRLSEAPYLIQTTTQFANYFESRAEVNAEFVQENTFSRDDGAVLADRKQAWREAGNIVDTDIVKRVAGEVDEHMHEPLADDVARDLTATWLAATSFHIPS